MKKLDLSQAISVLANFGVVAGIVFLAIEIRDSNTQARIAATQEVVAQRTEWRELIANSEALSYIYSRGLVDYGALTTEEKERFDLLMQSFMFKISANISARDVRLVGLNPNWDARSIEGDLLRMLDQPGFRAWWETTDRRGIPENVVTMTEELDAIDEIGK